MKLPRIRQQTLASIAKRYETHSARTLRDFLLTPETFEQVDPQQLTFAWEHREELLDDFAQPETLPSLCATCIDATVRYTYARNQYFHFSDAYLALLTQVYQTFFVHLCNSFTAPSLNTLTVEFRAAVQQHHARLRKLLRTYCQTIHPAAFNDHPLLKSVCCEEYSAPFQLRLLHIDPASMREPILDIGCGNTGAVVAYLSRKGYAAIGIDRLAPLQPGYIRADWFTFDFQENAWGTILAHQSFSTHFLHCHLHTPRLVEHYATLYLAILKSLQPDGCFFYAPGLPFFEPYIRALPEYDVQKISIDSPNIPAALREISYAVKIKKRKHPLKASL